MYAREGINKKSRTIHDAAFLFKWSSICKALLPALSGVARNFILTMQRSAFNFNFARKRVTFFTFLPKNALFSKRFCTFASGSGRRVVEQREKIRTDIFEKALAIISR